MVLEYILGHLEVIHKKKGLLFLYCAFSVLSYFSSEGFLHLCSHLE